MPSKKDQSKKKTPTKKTTAKKRVSSKKSTTKKLHSKIDTIENKIEHQFDEAMQDTQKFIKDNVPVTTKKAVSSATQGADAIASGVETLGEGLGGVADSIFGSSTSGSQGIFDASYTKKVSRLFVFRFLWWIIQLPISSIRGAWYMAICILHYVIMFISGERNDNLWKRQLRFRKHMAAWKSYFNALTDKRPAIIHPAIK